MSENDGLEIELVGPARGGAEPRAPAADGSLHVSAADLEEGRYHRLELIPWWDRERLAAARVLVVGAGALGNEIIKNFALLGLGHVFIIDLDTIELSNLTRSVLFRAEDVGRPKAVVAAERAREINPTIQTYPIVGNVIHDLGLGFFRELDLVVGGLDNREARLAINQNCWKVSVPWIDGAIEVLNGVARVFVPPDGACYECTMNEADYRLLSVRRSCALLTRDQMVQGKVPTTPTTASVIGGIQVQEAVKLLHRRPDLPVLAGRGFFFNGLSYDSYVVVYPRRAECLSHETLERIEDYAGRTADTSLRSLLELARRRLGPSAALDFGREVASALACAKCGTRTPFFKALGHVTESDARCSSCGELREPELAHGVDGSESFLDRTLADVGIPPYDMVTGRAGLEQVHFLLAGDRDEAMRGCPRRPPEGQV
jgi:molybdopterin/thiamine biosynthesis adenylyltransferase